MDESVVFIVMIIALVVAGIIGVIIYALKANELFPFKRMNDKDLDDCYDISYRKNNTKKK